MGAPRLSEEKRKQVLRLLEIPELTQKEIAEICGIGQATVSDIKIANDKKETKNTCTSEDIDAIVKSVDSLMKSIERQNKLLNKLLDVWGET